MKNTHIRRAIAHHKTQAGLARAIGAKQQEVSRWLLNLNRVPPRYCLAIEEATGGKVKRSDLRPDAYPPAEYQQAS